MKNGRVAGGDTDRSRGFKGQSSLTGFQDRGQAPLWDLREKAVCCICAPHYSVLVSIDRQFLWRLTRRTQATPRQIERLVRIVKQLERYADDTGIVWP